MRCISCNNILTTAEACSKWSSGAYSEMCTPCVGSMEGLGLTLVVPERFKKPVDEYEEEDIPPWEDSPLSHSDLEDDE
jgi:hypothetical protein